ncbi:MAG TPA: septal ring lytic transglycosylase RlpA family protein [Solirubrobacteraceae bacterium]
MLGPRRAQWRSGAWRRASVPWRAGAHAAALVLALTLAGGCSSKGMSPSATSARGGTTVTKAPAPDPPGDPPVTPRASPSTGSQTTPVTPPHTSTSSAVPPAHPVPAAFQPAAGAPSDAEVRSELKQLDAIQRAEHERALSAAAASLAGLLPWSLEPKAGTQVSVASVFRDYGLGLACGGVLGRDQLGVAHKTAPCGTLITFTYGGRRLTVPVIDRGPYIAGREWDLTGATAAALGFPGLGQIEWSLAG